jgi:hypothetical protein
MLKKITLTALFVIASAFVTARSVSAETHAKPAHRVDVTPKAPQGFCFPAGNPC